MVATEKKIDSAGKNSHPVKEFFDKKGFLPTWIS